MCPVCIYIIYIRIEVNYPLVSWFQGNEPDVERAAFTGPKSGLTEAAEDLKTPKDFFFSQLSQEFWKEKVLLVKKVR